jgi:hypothetical protein
LHRPWTSQPTASPRLEGFTLPCKKRRLTGTSAAAASAAEGTAAGLAGPSAAGSQAAGGLAAEGSTTAESLSSPTASVRLETASEGDTASCHTTCPRGFCNKVPEPIPASSCCDIYILAVATSHMCSFYATNKVAGYLGYDRKDTRLLISRRESYLQCKSTVLVYLTDTIYLYVRV